MANDGRIVVAYAGVHKAFQQALAAQELGALQTFYCALYDAPALWGGRVGGFVGHGLMEGRQAEGLDLQRVVEFPWPLLTKVALNRFYPRGRDGWLLANKTFDAWVASQLAAAPPDVFVGTASSDLHCLTVAKRGGAALLHDCPGLEPTFEAGLMREAAERARIRIAPRLPRFGPGRAAERKRREYELADVLMVRSPFQARSFETGGKPDARVFLTSNWVDAVLWTRRGPPRERAAGAPLKLLFVGSVGLRKGVPFLLRAMENCGGRAELTLVGPRTRETARVMASAPANVTCLPAQPRAVLRQTYEAHDVLVVPSVADAFANVALEAMACGLPVIMSDNCGAPTPDAAWRVPAMDVERLAARIMVYADDAALAPEHGAQATKFAAGFSPAAFRRNLQTLYQRVLAAR